MIYRTAVDIFGLALLQHLARTHHHDLVGHAQGFALVMGDEDGGHAQHPLQVVDLTPHVLAQVFIQGGKRFVHQEHVGFDDNGPCQSDTLLLPS